MLQPSLLCNYGMCERIQKQYHRLKFLSNDTSPTLIFLKSMHSFTKDNNIEELSAMVVLSPPNTSKMYTM